jgi:hypothetical protein
LRCAVGRLHRSDAFSGVKISVTDRDLGLLEQNYAHIESSSMAQGGIIWGYGIAILSVSSALLISQWPLLHLETAPVSLFLCAVMLTAWFGGVEPALLATALSHRRIRLLLPASKYIR